MSRAFTAADELRPVHLQKSIQMRLEVDEPQRVNAVVDDGRGSIGQRIRGEATRTFRTSQRYPMRKPSHSPALNNVDRLGCTDEGFDNWRGAEHNLL